MKDNVVYFIKIGNGDLYKIGTTNNIARRMKEHERNYKQSIEVIWISPVYSKYTALRVEEQTIQRWKQLPGFEYIRNDRFKIDNSIHKVTIKVRKEWTIDF